MADLQKSLPRGKRDPIVKFVTQLKEQRLLTDEDWKKMDEAILQEIAQAVVFAKESPFPPLAAALEDVFAN